MMDILAIAAHPDDVELAAAGTLIKHIESGAKVGIVDLTAGELGTRGDADIRAAEAEESRKIMGVSQRINLYLKDGFFEENETSLNLIIQVIRKYRPRVVLTNAVHDRHPDHERASALVSRACFLSGLVKIVTLDNGIEQQSWRPQAVYHMIQDRYVRPDFVVDITPCYDQKMAAVKAFKSQFYQPGDTGPVTPISSAAFLHFLEGRAREFGRSIGVEFGEGFTVERPLGAANILDFH